MPDDVHQRLKSKAVANGMSLSEYLLRELTKVSEQSTWQEVAERARLRGPAESSVSPEEMIRELRDSL